MKKWYTYLGGNPLNPENYFQTNIHPEFGVGRKLGAIYAKGDGPRPDEFSTKLKTMISDALISGISQPMDQENLTVFMKN